MPTAELRDLESHASETTRPGSGPKRHRRGREPPPARGWLHPVPPPSTKAPQTTPRRVSGGQTSPPPPLKVCNKPAYGRSHLGRNVFKELGSRSTRGRGWLLAPNSLFQQPGHFYKVALAVVSQAGFLNAACSGPRAAGAQTAQSIHTGAQCLAGKGDGLRGSRCTQEPLQGVGTWAETYV